MSDQIHAPPTQEEVDAYPTPEDPPELTTWSEDGGWCSACRGRGRRVAHLGNARVNVAFCAYCLGKLADEMRDTPSEGKDP